MEILCSNLVSDGDVEGCGKQVPRTGGHPNRLDSEVMSARCFDGLPSVRDGGDVSLAAG